MNKFTYCNYPEVQELELKKQASKNEKALLDQKALQELQNQQKYSQQDVRKVSKIQVIIRYKIQFCESQKDREHTTMDTTTDTSRDK